MNQATLFGDIPAAPAVVNVASVPQRSPFRYPGGKTWLVPQVRRWLRSLPKRPQEFIEPFVGGGIISLTVAFEELADHVTMVELDREIAAVWQTILGEGGAWLAGRIASFDLTSEAVRAELQGGDCSLWEQAFRTILKNRVHRGGILAPGAGIMKYGENGKGMSSRWYPQTLVRRILAITKMRDRTRFVEGDGVAFVRENAGAENTVWFFDPPYSAAGKKAGKRLYTHHELDHAELFRLASTLSGDFLMTYDDAAGVRDLARKHGFDTELVAMKNTHHTQMMELLIGRDLDWARRNTH
jgi:DNA adenine methylase